MGRTDLVKRPIRAGDQGSFDGIENILKVDLALQYLDPITGILYKELESSAD
jgi:hypothetical protein